MILVWCHLGLNPNTQDAARIDTAFDQPVLPPLNGEEPGVRTDEIERLRFMDVALMLVDRFEDHESRGSRCAGARVFRPGCETTHRFYTALPRAQRSCGLDFVTVRLVRLIRSDRLIG